MKKKIYLIVVFLCAISVLIIVYKDIYLKNRQKQMTKNVIAYLKREKYAEDEENLNIEKDNNYEQFAELESKKNSNKQTEIGILIIPSIDVEAAIYEGTSKETLKYTVRAFYRNKFMGAVMLDLPHIMKAHMLTIFQESMN